MKTGTDSGKMIVGKIICSMNGQGDHDSGRNDFAQHYFANAFSTACSPLPLFPPVKHPWVVSSFGKETYEPSFVTPPLLPTG
jgi:hypothetical protein